MVYLWIPSSEAVNFARVSQNLCLESILSAKILSEDRKNFQKYFFHFLE